MEMTSCDESPIIGGGESLDLTNLTFRSGMGHKEEGMIMAGKHNKLKKSGSGRAKSMSRDRCKRLGRMLCWVGKRYPGDADDMYHQKVTWPTNIMRREQMADVADWVLNTPNRWQLTICFYMEDGLKNTYIDTFEYETSQQLTAQELSHWRYEKIQEARGDNSVNLNNLVAETFEARII